MNTDTLTSYGVEGLLNLADNTGILVVLCTKVSVPEAGSTFHSHKKNKILTSANFPAFKRYLPDITQRCRPGKAGHGIDRSCTDTKDASILPAKANPTNVHRCACTIIGLCCMGGDLFKVLYYRLHVQIQGRVVFLNRSFNDLKSVSYVKSCRFGL
ncbi:MAG: hypothetical protein PWP14_1994 [Methanolobus sp.]|nr:hypothetical protein [Methanolobus sp.]